MKSTGTTSQKFEIKTHTTDVKVSSDWQYDENEATLRSSEFIRLMKQIEGKMYTIADGFARDDQQREATKSLMRFQLGFLKDEVLKWLASQKNGMGGSFPF